MYRSESMTGMEHGVTTVLPVILEPVNETKVAKKPKKLKNPARRTAALLVAAALFTSGSGFGLGFAAGDRIKGGIASNGANQYYTETANAPYAQTEQLGYSPSLLVSSSANVSIVDVVKRTANSIVSINVSSTVTMQNFFGRGAFEREAQSAGSGVIFFENDEKIFILTNFHVIERADAVTISIDDERQAPANFVGNDRTEDLAVISVLKSELAEAGITDYTIATFGDSDMLEVGETVVAIGNAIGEGKSATAGIVSALHKIIPIDGIYYDVIQTDASINPGNSGGALVNTSSQVIGINTAKISGNGVEGMGYSIPSNTVKTVIDQIMTNGSPQKPFLGIEGQDITEDILAANMLLPGLGVYVRGVYQGSGAAAGGLRANDIIVGVNGESVTTMEQLTSIIQELGVGGTAAIEVFRMDNNRNFKKEIVEAVIGDSNLGGGINF